MFLQPFSHQNWVFDGSLYKLIMFLSPLGPGNLNPLYLRHPILSRFGPVLFSLRDVHTHLPSSSVSVVSSYCRWNFCTGHSQTNRNTIHVFYWDLSVVQSVKELPFYLSSRNLIKSLLHSVRSVIIMHVFSRFKYGGPVTDYSIYPCQYTSDFSHSSMSPRT